ncbi:AMP-binding protein [Streptomyces sp. NPDC050560]|uniref:AMP-binding protein n=1 Tax=Streptomyces sp. NPDC050560 TaxID=3365630 RepID=UPI003798F590
MTRGTGPEDTLPWLLADAAGSHPGRQALSDGTRAFDYRALGAVAHGTAAVVRGLGAGRGDRIALLGPRDARLAALLYGVWRAGAVAVVVDPGWSAPDVRARLDAVGVCHALTAAPGTRAPGPYRTRTVPVDGLAERGGPPDGAPRAWCPTPSDVAYLSFTSGSSGAPKAVAVTHANAVHYARALAGRLGVTAADAPRVAHVTTLAADLGHTSWLLALATAGGVHFVADDLVRDPESFWAALETARVTMVKTTPSHLMALTAGRPRSAPALDTVLLGGEALPREFAARLLHQGVAARLVNHYGPTETTVGATCFTATDASQLPADEATVPIGTALGEVELRLVPDGERGELYIGGRGVAAGYFGRPEETARRFVRHGGLRMYRTGDVCRRRPDGTLVFVGRTDRQVKVRGFRVDPEEVERAMDAFPGVERSAVVVRSTDAGTQLLAAVRLSGQGDANGTTAALRSRLRGLLPEHAVPGAILAVPELPLGANGKVDHTALGAQLTDLVGSRARDGGREAAQGAEEPLARAVAELWAKALDLPFVAPGADVLGLGGDSILAMRTVVFLRGRGHRVSFADFYEHPTAAGLAAAARTAPAAPPPPEPAAARGALAPAQRWLLRLPPDALDDPRHFNQSVLLRCAVRVDAGALAAAVCAVLRRHLALRVPVGPEGPGVPRPADDADGADAFSCTSPRDEAAVGEICTGLHRGLDPAAGRLLRVHLFRGGPGRDDRIAVLAHHLAVDGLSWRILLDDLAAAYRAALDGGRHEPAPTGDFYAWAAGQPPAPAPRDTGPVTPLPVDDAGGAARPRALLWRLDEAATARLVARHGRAGRLEALLLAAFTDAVTEWSGQPGLRVEVETHGRDTGEGRHLDTVGWFTAVKWLTVAAATGAPYPGARLDAVREQLRSAPQLPMDTGGLRPEAAFNFLGSFRLPADPALGWSVADEQAGAARCTGADTLYRLRLTARVVHGRLVADLVHAAPRVSHRHADRLFTAFTRAVATAAGAGADAHHASPVSTSGQLLHTGATPPPRARVVSEPVRVLLTGATGYLGGHLRTALAERGARVLCLVRAEGDTAAAGRLGGAAAVAGDINRDGLGLTPAGLARARECRVVVHAAADVRLVASPGELERTNSTAVGRLLAWIDAEAPGAALHHVSTLGVAGTVPAPGRRFGEADLRIGQEFRTPYERAKFHAEETVRRWAASGREAYIHRSGHIAAHSRTGAFQRNLQDNRIFQTVRGYVLAGAAPRRPAVTFAFSYADTVAAGIAALVTHPGAAPGTYHVENPHPLPHDELVGWLAAHGYPITLMDDDAFAAALARAERRDPHAAGIASAWSALDDRGVVVDSAWTTAVLARLGVRFAAPTPAWWSRVLARASDTGFLPPPAQAPSTGLRSPQLL